MSISEFTALKLGDRVHIGGNTILRGNVGIVIGLPLDPFVTVSVGGKQVASYHYKNLNMIKEVN